MSAPFEPIFNPAAKYGIEILRFLHPKDVKRILYAVGYPLTPTNQVLASLYLTASPITRDIILSNLTSVRREKLLALIDAPSSPTPQDEELHSRFVELVSSMMRTTITRPWFEEQGEFLFPKDEVSREPFDESSGNNTGVAKPEGGIWSFLRSLFVSA